MRSAGIDVHTEPTSAARGASRAIGTAAAATSRAYDDGAPAGSRTSGPSDGDAGGGVDAVAVTGGGDADAALDTGGVTLGDGSGGGSPPQAPIIDTAATTVASASGRRIRPCYGPSRRRPVASRAVTDWDLAPKRVVDSQVVLSELMEITDANIMGIVHGGVVMKMVDTAAGLAAIKHIGGLAVTVAMDEMSFLAPVRIGDMLTARASVNDVGETSLEVGVRVEAENVVSGKRTHTSSAYLVFVALDDDGKPRPVPPLVAEGAVQERRQREARIRRQTRLAHKAAIREHRRGED
jgi:uncharacterized protein (TIGR00369 family)